MNKIVFLFLNFVLLFFLPALSVADMTADKEILAKSALELCQAQKNNDWAKVYDMYDSKYKASVSKTRFLAKRRGVSYGNCNVVDVEVSATGDTAKVMIKFDSSFQMSKLRGIISKQKWIKENGKWVREVKGMKSLFSN